MYSVQYTGITVSSIHPKVVEMQPLGIPYTYLL